MRGALQDLSADKQLVNISTIDRAVADETGPTVVLELELSFHLPRLKPATGNFRGWATDGYEAASHDDVAGGAARGGAADIDDDADGDETTGLVLNVRTA
jgi:hypothetical protein